MEINLTILESKYEEVVSKFNKIKNKANLNIMLTTIKEPYFKKINLFKNIKVRDILIEGEIKNNDWLLVAELEHTLNNQNIVFDFSSGEIDTSKFRNLEPHCDHCGVERFRRFTYIVKNIKTNELKQVGKACLKEYTGFNLSDIITLKNIFDYDVDEEKDNEEIVKEDNYFEVNDLILRAFNVVKEKGYNKNSIIENMFELKNVNKNFDVEAFKKWVENKAENEFNSDYFYNTDLIIKEKYIENNKIRFIASAVNSYLKEINNSNNSESDYLGNVGDKIETEIVNIRVLFTSYNSYGYRNSVESKTFEMIDKNNNVIIYKTSNTSELEKKIESKETFKIKATIKNLKLYNGIKQTVITRCVIE